MLTLFKKKCTRQLLSLLSSPSFFFFCKWQNTVVDTFNSWHFFVLSSCRLCGTSTRTHTHTHRHRQIYKTGRIRFQIRLFKLYVIFVKNLLFKNLGVLLFGKILSPFVNIFLHRSRNSNKYQVAMRKKKTEQRERLVNTVGVLRFWRAHNQGCTRIGCFLKAVSCSLFTAWLFWFFSLRFIAAVFP